MTTPVLILVHGRAQGGKDEAGLKDLWLETLRERLSRPQLPSESA